MSIQTANTELLSKLNGGLFVSLEIKEWKVFSHCEQDFGYEKQHRVLSVLKDAENEIKTSSGKGVVIFREKARSSSFELVVVYLCRLNRNSPLRKRARETN